MTYHRINGIDTSKREFTPEEYAFLAVEALDNWDFEVEIDNGNSPEWVERFKDALDFDAEYAESTFADDDGIIRINRAYSDVWDNLYEFATNMANA